MSVAQSIVRCLALPRRASLLDFLLRPSDGSVNFVANLFNRGSTVQLHLDNFISLQELLELCRKFVVLSRYQIHVLVQCVNLVLASIRLSNLLLVLIFQNVKLVLNLTQLTCPRLEPHFCVTLAHLKLLGFADLKLDGFVELRLSLLVSSILLFVVANFVVQLL